jgi:hypothetical protein
MMTSYVHKSSEKLELECRYKKLYSKYKNIAVFNFNH